MLSSTTVWTVFGTYMLMLVALGVYAWWKQKNESAQGYFTASGSISSFVLIMTYIASLMSTWVFFAGPGGYYRGGFVFYMSELSYIPLFPVIAYFVMNKVWLLNTERKYVTPADVYCDRFPSSVLRAILVVVFLIASLPYVASILVAGGKAADIASGGAISYTSVVLVMGITMILFVMFGGMRSVAWADTIQGWVFISILWIVVGATLFVGFDGSLTKAVSSVWNNTNEWFSYPGPDGWVPYSARIGYPLSCAIGWTIMLPHVFVRSGFSGQDMQTQRKLLAAVPILQTIVWTGTMVIGLLGVALVPGLATGNTELIIPYLINNIIMANGFTTLAPYLMVGFFIGAIAVGMSTANSFLLVAGSIISEDLVQKLFGVKLSESGKMKVGRVVIILVGIASMVLALNPPDLIWTLIMFAIAIVMPLFPVLIAGLYWKRCTTAAATVASFVGTIVVLLTYFVWNIGWKWYGALGMVAAIICLVVVSYMTKKTDEKVMDEFYGALATAESKYFEVEPVNSAKKEVNANIG